jgi:hypothetical protein
LRVGSNPGKKRRVEGADWYHRIVIPVHIPSIADEYFMESLEILKISLSSLIATIHSQTRISLVSDASCGEVIEFLAQFGDGCSMLDQLLISKTNIGKVNALNSAIKSNNEELFTLADADTLFLPGWQSAVENIFVEFESAGIVSPVPIAGSSMALSENASSTIFGGLIKRRIGRETIKDKNALSRYWESIGPNHFKEAEKEEVLVLRGDSINAAVGSGHFAITVRSEVFENSPNRPSGSFALGSAEGEYFDRPNNDSGFFRLSTTSNHAFHMGNRLEEWMKDELRKIVNSGFEETAIDPRSFRKPRPLSKSLVRLGKGVNKLIKRSKFFRASFLKSVGIKPENF